MFKIGQDVYFFDQGALEIFKGKIFEIIIKKAGTRYVVKFSPKEISIYEEFSGDEIFKTHEEAEKYKNKVFPSAYLRLLKEKLHWAKKELEDLQNKLEDSKLQVDALTNKLIPKTKKEIVDSEQAIEDIEKALKAKEMK